jgi:hypothetical protein
MNPLAQLLLASLISVILSLAALRLLSRPLARVLARICPDDAAAEFWLSYTQVMLTIAPLLATLLVDGFAAADQPMAAIRLALMAALVGLLVCLFAVGRRLGQFVRVPVAGQAAVEGRS